MKSVGEFIAVIISATLLLLSLYGFMFAFKLLIKMWESL